MTDRSKKLSVTIYRTAHGKPYYDAIVGIGDDSRESEMHDALDFPGEQGVKDFEGALKARYPGIDVLTGVRGLNFIVDMRSTDQRVIRDKFIEHWRHQLARAENSGYGEVDDPFLRIVPVSLSGKDRVRWWSGWFHYPLLIETSRREMEDSGKRLQSLFSLFSKEDTHWRDVVEEAYYEQVQRERLAIFERRREAWRIIRWGSTTALGLVLAAWSGIQVWDWFVGG